MDKLVKWLEDLIRAQKKSRAWRTFVSCLAAIVVFTTTYSLILPAITVESTATEDVGGLVMEGTDAGSTGAQAEASGEAVTVNAENEIPEEPVQEEVPVVETTPVEETSAETPASSSETGTAQPAASQPQTAETAESAATVTEEAREPVNGEVQTIGDKRVMTLKGDDFDVIVSGDLSVGVSDRTVLSVRGIADAEVVKSFSDRISDELLKIFVDTKTTEVLYQLVFTDENLVEYTPAGYFDVQFIFHRNTVSHTGEKIYAAIYDYLTDEMVLAEKNGDEYETPVISLDEYGIIKGITLKGMHFDEYSDIITLVAGPVNEELKLAAEKKAAEAAASESKTENTESADSKTESTGKTDSAEKAESTEKTGSSEKTESTGAKTDSAESKAEGPSTKAETSKGSEAAESGTLTSRGTDYTVTLSYGADAKIPAGASLEVSEIENGTRAYKKYLAQAKAAMGLDKDQELPKEQARFFDIKIMADGKEVQPSANVNVNITYDQPVVEATPNTEAQIDASAVHFGKEGTEVVEVSDVDASRVEFEAGSFSVYGVIYTVDFEYSVNGKIYQFSLTGGEKIALSALAEVLGIIDDSEFENTDAFMAEVKDVTFSDESLVRVSKNESGNDWMLESLQAFDTEEELCISMENGDVIRVKVTDAQGEDFTVSVEFRNEQGIVEQPASDSGLYIYLAAKMPDAGDGNNERIYWSVNKINPSDGRADITVSQLTRQNANPNAYSVQSILEASKSIEVKLLKDGYSIEQNNAPRGTIISGEVSSGSVYKGYELSITTDGVSSAEITAQKPRPYTYTVKAVKTVDENDVEENIDFTEGPWYLYGEVTRPDGVYFYVRELGEGEWISGTVDKLERYTGVNNRQAETVPSTNDYITFALLRPKDSGQSGQPGYFWTPDNMNVKALSGSSVDSKYTLEVVPGESHSDIILREGPAASINLSSYDENNNLEGAPALNADGSYFIVGELSFRDGLEDKTCYYVEKLDGTQSQTVTLPNFTGRNNDVQYLTGTRSFEPVLVHDQVSSDDAAAVMNKLLNQDSSLKVYRNSHPVESYRMTSVNGTLDAPEGKIILNKLPVLSAAGEIQDKDGNPTSQKDSDTYNLLVEITRDGKKAYAYQPLNFDAEGRMAPAEIADAFTEETTGETWYYQEEDTPAFYVVKGSFADHDSAVTSTERYAADQLMGTYTPSFTFDEDSCTVTTVLKETETPEGTPYNVRIDMMNKAQDNIEAVTPALTGNYFVIAALTPKGSGARGQTLAWTKLDVDLSDLNPDGTWSGTIPADGFKVLNAKMEDTGTNIGYNADAYDISLRLYHSNTPYTNYNDIVKYADDSAPDGYDFRGVYTKENDPATGQRKLTDDNTSVIRLHKAYDKVYGIRAYVDNPGLDIPEGEYVVKVKLLHKTGGDTYAFAKLKIDPSVGGDMPAVLEFYSDGTGRIWRDQNGQLQDGSNYTFTGNEEGVQLTLMSLTNGGESFAEWVKEPSSTNTYKVIDSGESINLYTFTFGKREDEENIGEEKHYVYDVLRFAEDVNGISKGELDEILKQARDFGLYTELLSKHATDMESNIGAAVLSGEIGADYGFSDNNIKVNRITVTKQYYENGSPVRKQVTLRLYPVETYDEETGAYTLGAMLAEKQGTTENDGVLKLLFDKLPAGKYVLKEVINGREYDYNYPGSTEGHIVDGSTVIQFQDRIIDIENINVNYNYFGDINDNVSLPPILSHSRHGLIVVGNEADYNALRAANGGEVASDGTTVKKAGDDEDYPLLDIPADMENLRALSNLLGVTANSKTVRIVNTTFEEINNSNGLNLKSDGRYIVVNVDMTDAPSVATVNLDTFIDNHRLMADFGADGNEDSSKVLYNFITRDSRGNISNYTGKINTATQAAGVILAPSAIVADLGGNWGGTIICREAQHTGSEIHSDSANKIQNKNTMLTNGESNKGNLELIKSFAEISDDRTTWFTFKVEAKDADGAPLTGEYPATGLKEGDKVSFVNGEATVLVRAQNKVFIVGLPENVTYSVTEIRTPETELYSYDHSIPEDGSGTIERDKTSSVEVVNTKNKETCSLVIVKTVEGPVKEQDVKNLQFEVKIIGSDGSVTGWLDKNGKVSSEPVSLKLSDGFTIVKNADGFITSATKKFDAINPGTYQVIESNYNIKGYHFVTEQSVVTPEEKVIEAGGIGRIDLKDVYKKDTLELEFTKIWKTADDQIEEWPADKTIEVKLYSEAEGAEGQTVATLVDTFNLSAGGGNGSTYSCSGTKNNDNTYTFKITGLPAVTDEGQEVTYYVKETKVGGYQEPGYGYRDSSGAVQPKTGEGAGYAGNEEIIINRPENAVTLPSSGGPGTKLFTIMGTALILTAGILFMLKRRTMK